MHMAVVGKPEISGQTEMLSYTHITHKMFLWKRYNTKDKLIVEQISIINSIV